ncbi:hypothetical protein DRB96_22745 [Streptomyces sp. ICC1]|uniref:SDR family NAD(P)-dependent oxidoreductase n=1 Tax=Streptomyces sp. ICC4 TaxID=2099584 RepID=UPI000DC7CF6B|nr:MULTISPECIES: SDR family oxidoreductase [unclassified Streptomyces]AWZ08188.1 hypothetical protein DRB89_30375 [Streptomyces sp. ICC4]AWZ14611.1 hypothetical protein DRB96_22745 [Streptomyces sp. ICC1]
MAGAGIRVVLNSARSEGAGKALAAELPDAVYVRGDVADADDARRIVRTAIDTYGSIPYAVSKAAVNRMTRLLASQLGPAVRVNAIAPGLIDTPWYEGEDQVWESSREWITENTPLRRVGTPDDVAEAALHLVNAAYTTGDVLTVDGGRHVV